AAPRERCATRDLEGRSPPVHVRWKAEPEVPLPQSDASIPAPQARKPRRDGLVGPVVTVALQEAEGRPAPGKGEPPQVREVPRQVASRVLERREDEDRRSSRHRIAARSRASARGAPGYFTISRSSTSKTSVAPGLIRGGAPRSP